MCVCVHVSVYVHVPVCVHVCLHVCMPECVCVCACTFVLLCVYARLCSCVCALPKCSLPCPSLKIRFTVSRMSTVSSFTIVREGTTDFHGDRERGTEHEGGGTG